MGKSKGFVTGHEPHIGRGDHAGMPPDVKIEKYPPCRNYPESELDDTMTDIDDIASASEKKASKFRSNQK